MKKKLFLVAFLLIITLMLNACDYTIVHKSDLQSPAPATPTPTPVIVTQKPSPTATTTPSLSPAPVQATVQPAPVGSPPRVTKHPTAEIVAEDGSCWFISNYENAIGAEWHFVSPDGSRDLTYAQAQKEFPTLTIIGGYTTDLKLEKVPSALNGWTVYCRFNNNSGVIKTNAALITVTPNPTPSPTPQVIDFEGRWAGETASRCQIIFETRAPGSYNVDIVWSNSAYERSCWKMTGNVTCTDNSTLTYSDGHYWVETYTSDTEYTVSDEVFDLTGSFSIQNGKLVWVNIQNGEQTVFVRA